MRVSVWGHRGVSLCPLLEAGHLVKGIELLKSSSTMIRPLRSWAVLGKHKHSYFRSTVCESGRKHWILSARKQSQGDGQGQSGGLQGALASAGLPVRLPTA